MEIPVSVNKNRNYFSKIMVLADNNRILENKFEFKRFNKRMYIVFCAWCKQLYYLLLCSVLYFHLALYLHNPGQSRVVYLGVVLPSENYPIAPPPQCVSLQQLFHIDCHNTGQAGISIFKLQHIVIKVSGDIMEGKTM